MPSANIQKFATGITFSTTSLLLLSEITTSATWSSESSIPQSIINKAVDQSTACCTCEGEGASFWTSAVNNQFFSEPPTAYPRKRVALYVFSVW